MATPGQYQSGTQAISPAAGNERVSVDTGGAVVATLTTAAIAGLSGSGVTTDVISTPISTVGNGTLTAAGIAGGVIVRTGPVAAYTDTTDTAANIVAQFPSFVLGATFFFTIKNATTFLETISSGTGVTMPATNVVGPWEEAEYFGTIGGTAAAPTVTFTHLVTTALALSQSLANPQNAALVTVGAGVITATGINGGVTVRGGAQANAAFTDTTDTAANIIAGNPALVGKVGGSFLYHYQNTTNANATITGGANVTVSGITVVPGGTWALYLVTATSATAVTMVGIASSGPVAADGTFVANGVTGVVVADTRITANSVIAYGLKTIGGTPAGKPYESAVTPGTGFTTKAFAGDTSTYNYTIIG